MATLVWNRYSFDRGTSHVDEAQYQQLRRVSPPEMAGLLRDLRRERWRQFWASEKRLVIAAAAIPIGLVLVWIPWDRTGASDTVAVGAMMLGGLATGIGLLSVLGAGFSAASLCFALRQECRVLPRAYQLANAAATYDDYCREAEMGSVLTVCHQRKLKWGQFSLFAISRHQGIAEAGSNNEPQKFLRVRLPASARTPMESARAEVPRHRRAPGGCFGAVGWEFLPCTRGLPSSNRVSHSHGFRSFSFDFRWVRAVGVARRDQLPSVNRLPPDPLMASLVWTRYSFNRGTSPVDEAQYQELRRISSGEMAGLLQNLRRERWRQFWSSEKRRVIATAAIPVGLALVWIPWERTGASDAVAVGAMMVGGLIAGIGVLSVLGGAGLGLVLTVCYQSPTGRCRRLGAAANRWKIYA